MARVRDFLIRDCQVRIGHTYKEANVVAHFLANLGHSYPSCKQPLPLELDPS
ncbi:hypothetical protein LINPERPRIM_LOCUS5788 [Linum perenne]